MKREVFENAYGKVLDFCLEKCYITLEWILCKVVM